MGDVQNAIIGLLLFSGIVLSFSAMGGNLAANYNATTAVNSSYLDKSERTFELVNEMKIQVSNTSITGVSWLDIPFTLASDSLSAIKLVFQSGDIVTGIASDITGLGFPAWTGALIVGVFTLILVFGIIKAVTKADI